MIKIFLEHKINWSLLTLFMLPFAWVDFPTDRVTIKLILFLILCFLILANQIIYYYHWSSKPLLIIDQDTLYINKLDTFNLQEIEYVKATRQWPMSVLSITFKFDLRQNLARSKQNKFFTSLQALYRDPYRIVDRTVIIHKELTIQGKKIERLIEEKIALKNK